MRSKIIALSNNEDFKVLLKKKRISNKYVTIFFGYLENKKVSKLNISFVTKKKIGNAVKRNKIKRKLKAIVQNLLKKRGAINRDYTYIVFGKSNAYLQKQIILMPLMEKSFNKIKIK